MQTFPIFCIAQQAHILIWNVIMMDPAFILKAVKGIACLHLHTGWFIGYEYSFERGCIKNHYITHSMRNLYTREQSHRWNYNYWLFSAWSNWMLVWILAPYCLPEELLIITQVNPSASCRALTPSPLCHCHHSTSWHSVSSLLLYHILHLSLSWVKYFCFLSMELRLN